MSLEAHLEMLELKHDRLEIKLEEEASRPMPDFSIIQTIKKQKLLIKEELERIAGTRVRHQHSSA